MKNFKELEVGKTYKNRIGKLIKIVSKSDQKSFYLYVGDDWNCYDFTGRYFTDTYAHTNKDLIELIEDVPTLSPNGQDAKPLTICEIDAKIAELQDLRKELDKSIEVDEYWLNTVVVVRGDGEYQRKGFYLNSKCNWEIVIDSQGELILVPTKK